MAIADLSGPIWRSPPNRQCDQQSECRAGKAAFPDQSAARMTPDSVWPRHLRGETQIYVLQSLEKPTFGICAWRSRSAVNRRGGGVPARDPV